MGRKIIKTEEQLTKDLEVAMKKLYKTLPGTPEEKIQILRTKFESEIQQLIQLNQTEKVSKKKEKSEPSEEMKAILDLLRQLRPHAEIAQQYGKSQPAIISQIAKRNGIYSPKAVRKLLKTPEAAEMTNQELAEKTGAYPEAIERRRKELEKGKQQAKNKEKKALEQQEENTGKTRTPISAKDKKKIIELAKQGLSIIAIASEVKRNKANISRILSKKGIMPIFKIGALLKKPESQQMSDEDLAAKTGVYPETIRRIREKLNLEVRKSASLEARVTVEAEDLQLPQESAGEEVPAHMEEPKEIALPEEQNSKGPEQGPEMEFIVQQIINYGKAGMEVPEIAEKTGASEDSINSILSENRIWSSQKIREKLAQPGTERMSNAIWARWTGVDEETITRIREELERDKKNEEHLSNERIQQQTKPIEEKDSLPKEQSSQETRTTRMMKQIQKYGRLGMEISEIKEKVGVSTGTVSHILRKYGIWNVTKLRKGLKKPGAEKRSDASWAGLAGVDIEVIRRIREEIKTEEPKEDEIEQPSEKVQMDMPYIPRSNGFREKLSVPRTGKLQITQEPEELEAMPASQVISYQEEKRSYPKNEEELAKKLGISVELMRKIKSRLSAYPSVAGIAKEYKVGRNIVEAILKIVQEEQYKSKHTEVQYKIKMVEIRGKIGSKLTSFGNNLLENQIDSVLTEFSTFLTKEDCALLAYGYAKAKSYQKAIDAGEKYLDLEKPTLVALQQRINDVIKNALQERGKEKDYEVLSIE